MTRKDYILIASTIAEVRAKYARGHAANEFLDTVAIELADKLARDNPRFDRTRFLKACKP